MAKLSKRTLQRLAVLRALHLWERGAFGPIRIHKVLFFAERDLEASRFFTFRRWHRGQYSKDIANALNGLRASGQIKIVFDGPSNRIAVDAQDRLIETTTKLFSDRFPAWTSSLLRSHQSLGYRKTDEIIGIAHGDQSHFESKPGQVIHRSNVGDAVDVDISDFTAEFLSDSVDDQLRTELVIKLKDAVNRPVRNMDWRSDFFADEIPSR
jgi:hypothetical protein